MNAVTSDLAAETAALDGLPAWIAPDRTAVLVIDMQVDFASPDGVLGQAGVDMDVVKPALAAAERLVDAARRAGAPVIFVGLMTRSDTDSRFWKERMRRRGGSPDEDSGLCRAGEVGAAFYGPTPAPGELVVPKIRYSGFFGTTLDAALKARGVDTVIACGLTTECCVDCTVRDAFHLDYHVFVATDACAAYEVDLHEGTLKSLELNCAILVDTDQVLAAWQGFE
ncbi:cysteine hydrolase family protein [Caulobacter sp. KR2-114]|uniref:cysteine hydrolase family protein n=1 Tax=Caulobacter sp. KR2-114 TaxID=3400912 RepID=UPI003C11EE6D